MALYCIPGGSAFSGDYMRLLEMSDFAVCALCNRNPCPPPETPVLLISGFVLSSLASLFWTDCGGADDEFTAPEHCVCQLAPVELTDLLTDLALISNPLPVCVTAVLLSALSPVRPLSNSQSNCHSP